VNDASLPRPGPVFISYSSADRDAAIAARLALERTGLEVFHDLEDLHAGDDWMARLQEALQGCSAFLVLVGQDGVRRWVGAEVQVAINRRISAREDAPVLPIYPVLLRSGTPDLLPPFLALFQATRWEPGQPLPDALLESLRQHSGTKPGTSGFDGCPFVGLKAYQAKDSHLFFGRAQETLDALACLGIQQRVNPERPRGVDESTHHRWLQIEGNSGSGKSSLVGAGMLPMIERGALWARTGYDHWQVLGPMVPGSDPLEKLAELIERALVPAAAVRHSLVRMQRMESDERALALALRDARGDDRAFLLVVDQFEELFTLSDPERRRLFDAQLAHALDDPECPLYLVSSVRSDFLDRFEMLPRLQAVANRRCKRYLLPPISEEGLREVIEGPALLAGLDVREVTGLILDDARDEVGALPLVENALFVLWSAREGHRLTSAQYRRLNGIAGMLSSQADELLRRLDSEVRGGRLAALELLLRLTNLNADGRHTRRRITRQEAVLVAGDGDPAMGERVVRALSGEAAAGVPAAQGGGVLRLVSTFSERRPAMASPGQTGASPADVEEHHVDLIHETLIRSRIAPGGPGQRVAYWPALFEYIESNRDRDLHRQQLRMQAESWSGLRGLARWRKLPGSAELRKFRKLRLPAQSLEGRFLHHGARAARLRLAGWVLLAAVLGVAGEALLWARQPMAMEGLPSTVQIPRWPVSYALYRPLWLAGYLPKPELLEITGGTFRMGCVEGRDAAAGSCRPEEVHPEVQVQVPGPVWMARELVTFEQFDAHVFDRLKNGEDAVAFPQDPSRGRGSQAVVGVSWHEARAYARWLGSRIGQACRLPTEAEWEFVARAGEEGHALVAAGHRLPGKVGEWVEDAHAPYRAANAKAPSGPAHADGDHVVRGTRFLVGPDTSRKAGRSFLQADETAYAVGFRVVCTGPALS